jgi:hypothetical protein
MSHNNKFTTQRGYALSSTDQLRPSTSTQYRALIHRVWAIERTLSVVELQCCPRW